VKKNNEAVLSKSLNHDDGISKEAGAHACSNIFLLLIKIEVRILKWMY
jgi:hypothetical protein